MANAETSMGGAHAAFPETLWSSILADKGLDSELRRRRLNRLLEQYWRPVYMTIRMSTRAPVEEAKDLTQEFFCRLLDDDVLSRYQPAAGRFRTFLKAVLRNFLANQSRDRRAIKRGGGQVVTLDVQEVEAAGFLEDREARTPEELFDRQWARDVMESSLEDLRRDLRAEGKEIHLALYEAHDLGDGPPPTYEQLAGRHGLSVWDVKNHLDAVRERLRTLLLRRISDYVTSREELLQEMSELFHG